MRVEVENNQLKELLQKVGKSITDVTSDAGFLDAVGLLLVGRGKQNIGGSEYTPLAPSTILQKRRKGYSSKPLQRTGLLARSLNHTVSGGQLYLRAVKYGKHHQYGAPKANIPQREIYTVENDDISDIRDFAENTLNRLIHGK